jgi:SAM-dependent methyltransferase
VLSAFRGPSPGVLAQERGGPGRFGSPSRIPGLLSVCLRSSWNMLAQRANRFHSRRLSLTHFQIRRDLRRFSATIGGVKCLLDLGSGSQKPYADLFEASNHIGIDLYEPSDLWGDISSLPFADQVADLVLCTEVLEHVAEPGAVLAEARRVLEPGGHLVVTVPLIWGEHDHVDFQRWTRMGLQKLLETSGFDVLTIKGRGGLFSAIGCLIAQAPLQILGSYAEPGNWFTKLVYSCAVAILLPIPWLLSVLDILDRRRRFVLGYSVLCTKGS